MRFIFMALAVLVCSSVSAQKWHTFTSKAGAFSATFPEEPTLKELTRETPEGYTVTAHLHMMFKEPITAFVIYNEFETGINIENDSVYLTSVTEEMVSKFTEHAPEDADKTLVKDIVFDGYPGKSFDIDIEDITGHVKIFLRSNRAYIVAGVFPKKRKADLDKFLTSFKLLPFEPTKFTTHEVGRVVKMDLPSAPIFDQESSDEIGDGAQAFASKDPNTGDSYSILITPYSKYTQFESDSAWLEQRISAFRSETPSNNQERDVVIDGRPAKDLIVVNREHLASRYLTFLRGNQGYLILVTGHPTHLKNATSQKIFTSVKFVGQPTTDLFSDKSSLLLKDLVNPDTSVSNEAKESFNLIRFTEKNLEELMAYLQKNYADDSERNNSRKELLLDALNEIESEKSVAFIEKIFPTLNKHSIQELTAITAVAKIKTREALDARIRLIAKHTPADDIVYHPILGLYTVDSADQRYFFDKTNYLLKQKPYKLSLYYYMMHLMEEKRLKVQEIASWRPTLNADFESGLKAFKSDSVVNSLDDLIVIMKHFETLDKKQIASLKELTSSHNTYIGILASSTLLKHKQVVAPTTINRFAEDVYARLTLYDQFEKDNLLQHYPKAYLNQDSLAVSQVYSYLEEDGFVPAKVNISYAGLEEFEGQPMKFYVVKIYDDESDAWYRGVVGPFDPKKLSTWGELNTVDFEESNSDDKQYLRDYIAASVEAMQEE